MSDDWKTHCPKCNSTDGKLDMMEDPGGHIGLYYVFDCHKCNVIWITGMVMGPIPELREKYLSFVHAH